MVIFYSTARSNPGHGAKHIGAVRNGYAANAFRRIAVDATALTACLPVSQRTGSEVVKPISSRRLMITGCWLVRVRPSVGAAFQRHQPRDKREMFRRMFAVQPASQNPPGLKSRCIGLANADQQPPESDCASAALKFIWKIVLFITSTLFNYFAIL